MSQQGIRNATNKFLKRNYKYLTSSEKRLIKIKEQKEQAEKFLYGYYGFYSRAPRLSNGIIDWDKISDRDMDLFELSNKAIEKYNNQNEDLMNKAINIFHSSQFSLSQSF